jgi:hypothetical protein
MPTSCPLPVPHLIAGKLRACSLHVTIISCIAVLHYFFLHAAALPFLHAISFSSCLFYTCVLFGNDFCLPDYVSCLPVYLAWSCDIHYFLSRLYLPCL